MSARSRLIILASGGGPADDPSLTDDMWMDAARAHFKGEIVVARDGLEL